MKTLNLKTVAAALAIVSSAAFAQPATIALQPELSGVCADSGGNQTLGYSYWNTASMRGQAGVAEAKRSMRTWLDILGNHVHATNIEAGAQSMLGTQGYGTIRLGNIAPALPIWERTFTASRSHNLVRSRAMSFANSYAVGPHLVNIQITANMNAALNLTWTLNASTHQVALAGTTRTWTTGTATFGTNSSGATVAGIASLAFPDTTMTGSVAASWAGGSGSVAHTAQAINLVLGATVFAPFSGTVAATLASASRPMLSDSNIFN